MDRFLHLPSTTVIKKLQQHSFFAFSLSLSAMDYERIDKVETGVLSPTKLRMKLLGAQHIMKKEGRSSSRASPSKLEDFEHVKRNLLWKESVVATSNTDINQAQSSTRDSLGQEILDTKSTAVHKIGRQSSLQIQLANNFCIGHPLRNPEEGGGDSDSWVEHDGNFVFEFHQGEKLAQHPALAPLYRHLPSKWNDAEKWIVSRQAVQENASRKSSAQHQCGRNPNPSCSRIAPESTAAEQKFSLFQSVACNTNSKTMQEKFAFMAQGLHSGSVSSRDASCLTDASRASGHSVGVDRLLKEKKKDSENADIISKQPVYMRDVGTEMTPIPSQEPSRTGTPIGNLTPSHSPIYSMPSSPRQSPSDGATKSTLENEKDKQEKGDKRELSEREREQLVKTRREIAALGLQLGKLNIASWASKEAEPTSSRKTIDEEEEQRKEYAVRAAAWEEAENSKHMARYKREEVKILAWESRQIAKYEAKMRNVEIRAIKMRSRAETVMMEKFKATERRVEERRSNAAVRKNLQAANTSRQAELMRQQGQVPSHVRCCSWFF